MAGEINGINLKEYPAPTADLDEVKRYLGYRKASGSGADSVTELEKLISECEKLLSDSGGLSYRTAFRRYKIAHLGDGLLDLGFCRVKSKGLSKNLEECDEIVLFAATVGREMDLLISRYRLFSPSKSVCLQAIGAERVESLCDAFCLELRKSEGKKGRKTCPRFSPGYGDLPLSLQTEIFNALELQKTLGIFLNESLLMVPSKSVTAIVGIKDI